MRNVVAYAGRLHFRKAGTMIVHIDGPAQNRRIGGRGSANCANCANSDGTRALSEYSNNPILYSAVADSPVEALVDRGLAALKIGQSY
jgi:hypothetical protein